MVTEINPLQSSKALLPIEVTLVNPLQSLKALLPIEVTPSVYALVCCYDDPASFLPPLVDKYRRLNLRHAYDWDVLYYTRLLPLFARDGAVSAADVIRERYQETLAVLLDPARRVEGDVDLRPRDLHDPGHGATRHRRHGSLCAHRLQASTLRLAAHEAPKTQ